MIPRSSASPTDSQSERSIVGSRYPKRSHSRRRLLILGALVVVAIAVLAVVGTGAMAIPAAPVPTVTPVPPPINTAHGAVRPIAEAKIGTLTGGTIIEISVSAGDRVEQGQEVARVQMGDATEIITAPWGGTVADVMAQVGDTVSPGTTFVTIDNLTRLQVTTADVDEYLLPHVRVGQTVTMTVEALNGRELTGQVRTVAIEPRLNATGDAYYPVIIDPNGSTSGLKPGMTVDITFPN